MFAGVNMFLAQLRLILAEPKARAKMSSEKGQKHIYAREHQLYYYFSIISEVIIRNPAF